VKTEQSRSDSERHGSRLEFETLISELSSGFINLAAGEVDREITETLPPRQDSTLENIRDLKTATAFFRREHWPCHLLNVGVSYCTHQHH